LIYSYENTTLYNVPGSWSHWLQMWTHEQTVEPYTADLTCYSNH